jgi:phospholipid/cholesterol/gamma-HCH transport system ATP-binding protein
MKDDVLITVRNLVVKYGDNLILDNISFDVFKGEILFILGGSGCGKTTLIRHLMGLDRPFSGNIVIDGIDLTSCRDADFMKTLRKIGMLFQGSALFGSMSLAENIALPIQEFSGLSAEAIHDLVRIKLCRVDLNGFEQYLPHELSGGMKKRAGLARALALNPKILFLDEPTAGLDPVIATEIDELILNINKNNGTTIIVVTHELYSILGIAERIIMLDKNIKGIIAEGNPRFLKEHSDNPYVRKFLNRHVGSATQTGN